jgi:hypothetical protein
VRETGGRRGLGPSRGKGPSRWIAQRGSRRRSRDSWTRCLRRGERQRGREGGRRRTGEDCSTALRSDIKEAFLCELSLGHVGSVEDPETGTVVGLIRQPVVDILIVI